MGERSWPNSKTNRGWVLSESRFLTLRDVEALRARTYENLQKSAWKRRSKVREWIALEIALLSGLRVGEIADLTCGDLFLTSGGGSLLIRNGKGGKQRVVKIGSELAGGLMEFLDWKRRMGEPAEETASLIRAPSTGGHLTTRAFQKMFHRVAEQAGIIGHRFHDTRHTFASFLYRASGNNLRLVQKQLGHASVRTTEVYADVFDDEAEKAVNALYASSSQRSRRPTRSSISSIAALL